MSLTKESQAYQDMMEHRYDQAEHSYELFLEQQYLASLEPLPRSAHHGTDDAYIGVAEVPVDSKYAHVYLSTWSTSGHSTAMAYLGPDQLEALAQDLIKAAAYIRNQGKGRGL